MCQIDNLWVDVYVDVGCGGGVVPECERAVAVEDGRDGEVVVEDSGDVGRRAEATDYFPCSFPQFSKQLVELSDVHPADLVALRHEHLRVGDVPPGQQVRVVLHLAHDHSNFVVVVPDRKAFRD